MSPSHPFQPSRADARHHGRAAAASRDPGIEQPLKQLSGRGRETTYGFGTVSTSPPDPVAAIDDGLAALEAERARLQAARKVLVGESASQPAQRVALDPVEPVGGRRGLHLPHLASKGKRAMEVAVAVGIVAPIGTAVTFYNGCRGDITALHGQQLAVCEAPTGRAQLTAAKLAKCRVALNQTVGELSGSTPDLAPRALRSAREDFLTVALPYPAGPRARGRDRA